MRSLRPVAVRLVTTMLGVLAITTGLLVVNATDAVRPADAAASTTVCGGATPTQLVVTHGPALANSAGFSFPSSVTATGGTLLDNVVSVLCALPQPVAGASYSCPADFGPTYSLVLSVGSTGDATVTADPTGCEFINGAAATALIADDAFWQALGAVMGVSGGRDAFAGTVPIATQPPSTHGIGTLPSICSTVGESSSVTVSASTGLVASTITIHAKARVRVLAKTLCALSVPAPTVPCPAVLHTPESLRLAFNAATPVTIDPWADCPAISGVDANERWAPVGSPLWTELDAMLGTHSLPLESNDTSSSSSGIFAIAVPVGLVNPGHTTKIQLYGFAPRHPVVVQECASTTGLTWRGCKRPVSTASATVGRDGAGSTSLAIHASAKDANGQVTRCATGCVLVASESAAHVYVARAFTIG